MNAIQLLKDDHKKLRKLLAELVATTSRGVKTRADLLRRIGSELHAHTGIEEEIFYPALKAAAETSDDAKMYFEAKEEHRAVLELVLPDLERTDPRGDCFGGRAKVLKELIEHHAGEEERDMFPRARQLLATVELQALGERMARRKQELLSEPGLVARTAGKLLEVLAPEERAPAPMPPQRPSRAADGVRAR